MPRVPASLRGWAAGALVALVGPHVPTPALAQQEVDVELVLAVDVSLSMSPEELAIQRDGYAAALVDDEVVEAIRGGALGRVAVTYIEWAGEDTQRIVVPWTLIASRADAEDFAGRLTAEPPRSARRTSISGAMSYALDLFAESGFRGLKRVVDISGDGPNNQGTPVEPMRALLLESGVVVNGLPLMTRGGYTNSFDIDDLDVYYAECVIGGPGAFMVPVNDWGQFPEAVRRKLVTELAGSPWPDRGPAAPPVRLVAEDAPGYDCLVGEKMWDDRSWMRGPP